MKKWLTVPLVAAIGGASIYPAQAADIRMNGFASAVAGRTLNEGNVTDYTGTPISAGPPPVFPTIPATFDADYPNNGTYDDDWSFKPDSNYGVQIMADLGDGLSVTAQITGAGGNNFDAEVQWAYLSYDVTTSGTLSVGRQRIPFFFYSDYLDVAYAYHWIRPPVEVYALSNSAYEGVQYAQLFSFGSWDGRVQVMYGGSSSQIREFTLELEDSTGIAVSISNDWLQLRASYFVNDLVVDDTAALDYHSHTDENPLGSTFAGVAARAQLGNGFVVAEYTQRDTDDPAIPKYGQATKEINAWYVSAGYTFGSLTPHITYAEETAEHDPSATLSGNPIYPTTVDEATESVTVGLRWDFHPSAAFKVEYMMSDDTSDQAFKNVWGEIGEVDVVSLGFDLIF